MRFLLFLLLTPFLSLAGTGEPTDSNTIVNEGKLNWLTLEEVMEKHAIEPKYWLVDVYTDWCGWCKRMDASTFTDSAVVAELNKNFYVVKFDAESKQDITIGGKTYVFVEQGRNGYHELAAEMMNGKMSYPTIVYFDNEGKKIQPVPGYQKPEQILPILKFLGTGLYKTQSWEEFLKSYSSPYPVTGN